MTLDHQSLLGAALILLVVALDAWWPFLHRLRRERRRGVAPPARGGPVEPRQGMAGRFPRWPDKAGMDDEGTVFTARDLGDETDDAPGLGPRIRRRRHSSVTNWALLPAAERDLWLSAMERQDS